MTNSKTNINVEVEPHTEQIPVSYNAEPAQGALDTWGESVRPQFATDLGETAVKGQLAMDVVIRAKQASELADAAAQRQSAA